jgi:hypothetical protein
LPFVGQVSIYKFLCRSSKILLREEEHLEDNVSIYDSCILFQVQSSISGWWNLYEIDSSLAAWNSWQVATAHEEYLMRLQLGS